MTKYSKLREIATNVLQRIATAASGIAGKLAAHQESNSVEFKRGPVNMKEDSKPGTQHSYSSHVQERIKADEVRPQL